MSIRWNSQLARMQSVTPQWQVTRVMYTHTHTQSKCKKLTVNALLTSAGHSVCVRVCTREDNKAS